MPPPPVDTRRLPSAAQAGRSGTGPLRLWQKRRRTAPARTGQLSAASGRYRALRTAGRRALPACGTQEDAVNSYRQSLYTGVIRVLANLVMVAAVFVGMYMSAHSTAASELVFSVWFFGISLPVWGAAFWLTRLVRRRWPAVGQSLVDLPKRGPCLVCWQVAQTATQPLPVRSRGGRTA